MVTESFVLYEGNMLKVNLICIGKLKEKFLIDAQEEYLKRLKKYTNIELIELNDSNIDEEKQVNSITKKERENLVKLLKNFEIVIFNKVYWFSYKIVIFLTNIY